MLNDDTFLILRIRVGLLLLRELVSVINIGFGFIYLVV